jgi:hypothetical protein
MELQTPQFSFTMANGTMNNYFPSAQCELIIYVGATQSFNVSQIYTNGNMKNIYHKHVIQFLNFKKNL